MFVLLASCLPRHCPSYWHSVCRTSSVLLASCLPRHCRSYRHSVCRYIIRPTGIVCRDIVRLTCILFIAIMFFLPAFCLPRHRASSWHSVAFTLSVILAILYGVIVIIAISLLSGVTPSVLFAFCFNDIVRPTGILFAAILPNLLTFSLS